MDRRERASSNEQGYRQLQIGLTLLVGASAGLVSLHGDASLGFTVAAVALGLVAGGALAWYVIPSEGLRSARGRR